MNYAIILAGGSGTRAGGSLPKQFQRLGDRRMLWWSVEAFFRYDSKCQIVVPIHPAFISQWDELFGELEEENNIKCKIVEGGASRIASVKNALRSIEAKEEDRIFIHDAARPYVTLEIINTAAGEVEKGVGVIPVVPVTDSLRRLTPEGSVSVNRSEYVAVQTPQVFLYGDIVRAYDSLDNEEGLTDDASVGEKYGLSIKTIPGSPNNIKITYPKDFGN